MIIHIKKDIPKNILKEFSDLYQAFIYESHGFYVGIISSNVKYVESQFQKFIQDEFVFDTDMQLSSILYREKRRIILGDNIEIGGNSKNTLVAIGPCSVESKEQMENSAKFIASLGLKFLRAGTYKPRTSPYTFQGLGKKGLEILDEIRERYDLKIVTEARDSSHIEEIIEYADVVQIGAKAMYDHGILKSCSKTKKPILIKRGFGSTLQELIQAAEFILSGGNENVILCERGIRTFENKTRFTLDLCGVAYLKKYTNLPVILDPSHAMGYSYGVPDLTRSCLAMGVDGLLIEVHPDPKKAKSDASQQLNHFEFKKLYESLKPIANAIDRRLI
ncbi:3-deoxy-7-phosphoheptulonate synthase [Campylobacter jejuni]